MGDAKVKIVSSSEGRGEKEGRRHHYISNKEEGRPLWSTTILTGVEGRKISEGAHCERRECRKKV